jgi:protein TonB
MGARVVSQPMPPIPAELRDQPINVVAVAHFVVAPDGHASVTLTTGTPDPRLNRWLLGVLATWTFFPAVEDGQPVASTLDLRVPIEIR